MEIQKLKIENIENIVSWCQDKDADFLTQWAGKGYEYPLTKKQIEDRLSEGAETFEPQCRKVCTDEEYEQLTKAFFEKERNISLKT